MELWMVCSSNTKGIALNKYCYRSKFILRGTRFLVKKQNYWHTYKSQWFRYFENCYHEYAYLY